MLMIMMAFLILIFQVFPISCLSHAVKALDFMIMVFLYTNKNLIIRKYEINDIFLFTIKRDN